jgi:class 3 adenylate cyclase
VALDADGVACEGQCDTTGTRPFTSSNLTSRSADDTFMEAHTGSASINESTLRTVRVQQRNYIFHKLRFQNRYIMAPTFVLFSFVDYLYLPENFSRWLGYRLIFLASALVAPLVVSRVRLLKKNVDWVAAAVTLVACGVIQQMIFESGGYNSLYNIGLILVVSVGLAVFRLRGLPALLVQVLSFLPISFASLLSVSAEEYKFALIQGAFYLTITALAFVTNRDELRLEESWGSFKVLARREFEKNKRTEFLKGHFPKLIRDQIEAGNFSIENRIFQNAVIGFTDIASSTAIANAMPLELDWKMKERFLEAATKRALETDMVVLTHLGDGFLFLANFNEDTLWQSKMISFFEHLIHDYEDIFQAFGLDRGQFSSGVKFGVSTGPTMVGFLGKGQSYYTAIGPDVNLASRLCAQARPNQIVLSEKMWIHLKDFVKSWDPMPVTYGTLKGFKKPVIGVHVSPNQSLGRAKNQQFTTTGKRRVL